MRGIFGWSLPPGVSMRDIDQSESPCMVCARDVDHCICAECPQCATIGDLRCYAEHGLVESAFQIASRQEAEARWRKEAEEAYYESLYGEPEN